MKYLKRTWTKLQGTQMKFRTNAARDSKDIKLDPDKKSIQGFSVVSQGEALGHDLWLDAEFLSQVVKAGATASIKSRFTHPGLCADGMGKQLGKATNFRLEGSTVRADLTLLDAASKAPDGDIASYVLSLAKEAPDTFGASIVFSRDEGAEDAFIAANSTKKNGFKSPDPKNVKNFPHARLSKLSAVDIVDEPAANPAGFFSDPEELASKAEVVLNYVFGVTQEVNQELFGGFEPEKVKTHVQSFLQRNGLEINKMDKEVKDKPDELARFKALNDKYGKDRPQFVIDQFSKGNDLAQADSEVKDLLIKELEEKLKASTKVSGAEPAAHVSSDKQEFTFGQMVNQYVELNKCTKAKAISSLISKFPNEYEVYKTNGK